ncbi:MAG: amidohydrolase family protein [Deltaproteobacteria bacterium]|nr:amidohydrolase family protein [Deltaproteobacteria bacterium]
MHRISMIAVALAAACGSARQAPSQHAGADATAFVDVTVVPMTRDGALAHQTVIVRGGAIEAIGPAASTPVPAGARRIDGRGKWLAPGLADMHVHTYDPRALQLFVAHGVTTVRVMWGDAASIGVRDAIRADPSRRAPTIYTAGPIVDGNPPVWPGSLGLDTAAQATEAVAAQVRAGYDFVKVYSRLPAELYEAIVAEAAARSLPVMGHVPNAVGLGRALAAKQVTIEHLDGYTLEAQPDDAPVRKDPTDVKARLAAWKHVDPARLADAIARTRDAGTWNCATLVVLDRLGTLDRPRDMTRPEWKLVSKASLAQWSPANDFRFTSWTPEDFDTARGSAAWGRALVKQLHDAGAGLVAGTDVGNPWLVPGLSLHEELALFAKAGLTPEQALRTATANPARVFHADGKFGVVAAGARADLILLDGDPLADIANTEKLAGVMLRGRWLPREELERLRREVAEIYDDKRSRFADDAPPTNSQRALYRERGPITGEERLTLAAGATTVVGEVQVDGIPPQRWEVALDGSRLSIHGEGIDVTVVRDGAVVRLYGNLGHDEVKLEDQLAPGELLGGETIVADLLLYAELMKLAPGESRTIPLAVVHLGAAPGFQHMSIAAKRLADGTATVAGAGAPVPTRTFEYSAGFGPPSQVTLDPRGWPVETPMAVRIR